MGPGSAAHRFVMHRVRGTSQAQRTLRPHVEIAGHGFHQGLQLSVEEMVGAGDDCWSMTMPFWV